ncbi:hypothetical protein ICN28_09370, partial [Polynucleobacter sp. 30F-ANTBAC]|uniref:beta strand repeat-containing protein n=1 Tax=Polynucleobacter sp. 30F-ANTBAC TaxID=2689095 RepID=UPI001C0BAFE3
TGGTAVTGVGTIKDDGTGSIFTAANTTGTPDTPTAPLDDDRPLAVSSVTVNEGSPYAVFTVTGTTGELTKLSLTSGTGAVGTDTGTALEYFDPTANSGAGAWVPYTPDSFVAIPAGGLLVRTPVTNDPTGDNNETVNLVATNTGGTAVTGVGTIKDDGTGSIFTAANTTGTPDTPTAPLDDDRPLAVSSVTVNEGSPYAVFTVTGTTGELTKLSLTSGTGAVGTDTGTALEYFDPTANSGAGAWVPYTPDSFVAIPAGGLLVRTPVTNDPAGDNNETVNLVATNTGGTAVTGVGTIKDDGTGSIFTAANTTGTPDTPTAPLDDDRPLAVSSVTVNEGSPYAVFTVTGTTGELTKLSLTSGTGAVGTDTGTAIEYFDPTANSGAGAWVPYTPDSFVAIPAGGLLVRTPVTNDPAGDNNETVNLVATNTGGTAVTGVGTIKDDGTGAVFVADDPATVGIDESAPANGVAPMVSPPGFNSDGVIPSADASKVPNDDRPLTVSAIAPVVNEASPYAAFEVSGAPNQLASLSLPTNTTSPLTSIEFWNGSAWVPYSAGDLIPLDNAGKALVRVLLAPEQDSSSDNSEPFSLTATNTDGTSASPATVTIKDDGTGAVFDSIDPTSLVPPTVAAPTPTNGVVSAADAGNLPNDDRPLAVTSVTVNEGSPYAVFQVTGSTGEYTSLALSSGTAIVGTDAAPSLQYFDGSTWQNYTPGDFVQIPAGGLLVRTAISNDTPADNNETFNLLATNTGGSTATGVGTIKDDGTGSVFSASNNTITPDTVNAATLNDDRPLTVNNLTVNEGSPYAVFTVGGTEGQYVKLATANDTASSADYGSSLEYFDGTTWQPYTPNSFVQIPTDGDATSGETGSLLVRTAITNDGPLDTGETFTLTATNVGTGYAVGTATIMDMGTGSIFNANNTSGTPDTVATPLDDDRSLFVDDVIVNEGSPYAVFTVTGIANQVVSNLALAVGDADPASGAGVDYGAATGTGLEYWDSSSSAWVPYVSGQSLTLDVNGTLLVRTPIANDTVSDNGQTFKLIATNSSNVSVEGICTIKDDGTGALFVTDDPNTSVNEAAPELVNNELTSPTVLAPTSSEVTPSVASPLPNDDRPLTVNNLTVNEGSPYAVFTVGGASGQYVELEVADGTATSADYGTDLEYFDGSVWQAYMPGDFVQIPITGTSLLVRALISNDTPADNGETFTLTATNTGTSSVVGTATIKDDGTGNVYSGTSGTPDVNPSSLDLDRNDAPEGANKTIDVLEDGSYTFSASDFGFSDPSDTPANSLQSVTITTLPIDGTLKLDGVDVTVGQVIPADDIGDLVYAPVANENGTGYASFTFQVTDDGGTLNGGQDTDQIPNTITINITPVNDVFVDANEAVTTPEDTPKSGNVIDSGLTSGDGAITLTGFTVDTNNDGTPETFTAGQTA